MISKATARAGEGGWSAIRCGFGLAGIVLQNGAAAGLHPDVARFGAYLWKHSRRRPPDHLAVEFYAKESTEARSHFGARAVYAFRHNIARHDGKASTLRAEAPWAMPECFEELVAPQVFPVEAWDPAACPDDDLWPCPAESSRQQSRIGWPRGKA